MAGRMSPVAKGGKRKARGEFFSSLILLCTVIAAAPAAMAQVLNDPTRPASEFLPAAPGEAGAAANPLLQSVKISASEKSAIIGGETVKLGGKYGDARVIKITESEVVLRSANGIETLRMYPGVTIKAVEPPPAAPRQPLKRDRRPAATTQGKQG